MRITRAVYVALALGVIAGAADARQPSPVLTQAPQAPRPPEGGTLLKLTAEEKHTILENVDRSKGQTSTLGLGTLAEGEAAPTSVTLTPFDDVVVQKIAKLAGHKYFVADKKLAVVDRNNKIAAVIDDPKGTD